jgi:hypothetical protein
MMMAGGRRAGGAMITIAVGGAVTTEVILEYQLAKLMGSPENINAILADPNLRKSFIVQKLVRTKELDERNKYYKGVFLLEDLNTNRVQTKMIRIGKTYNDYEELVGLLQQLC